MQQGCGKEVKLPRRHSLRRTKATPTFSMKVCSLDETMGTVNTILMHNSRLFTSLPHVPDGEARVLHVHSHGQGCDVIWGGLVEDIWKAHVPHEVKVQLKCLYEQTQQRNDGYRGWSSVVFLTTQDSEQSLYRILLKPGRHHMIAAIGGCDCMLGH